MIWKRGILLFIAINLLLPAFPQTVFEFENEILVTDGDGTALIDPWAGGFNAPQFSTCDLNNDQIPDLIVFERTSNRVKTFIRENSRYVYNPAYESFFPNDLLGWMILRDFNCDGKKDIFTHSRFGIRVFQNVSQDGVPQWDLTEDPIFTEGSSGQVNLQVNITDIPGIDDLDNDGDLDILVYNFSTGGGIEYHKNLSVENTGNCGLVYRRETRRWGEFDECECDVFAFGTEECNTSSKLKHAGGKTILTFDIDGDSDKDVLIGQEDCEPIYFLENEGSPENALMRSFSNEFPNPAQKIEFFIFPSAFYEDVTGDGIPDLISSSNFDINDENGIDFQNSVWLYQNTSISNPAFNQISKNWLQGDMIDVGENASLTFADLDIDGDLDLFIANRGTTIDRSFAGSISYYENIGSSINPAFTLIETDFLGLRSRNETDLKIQFSDLNRDGLPDLILGGTIGTNSSLKVIYNEGNNNFRLENPSILPIEFGVNDNFLFTEINGDQNTDLLVARENGRLDFYRSNGDLNFNNPQQGFYGIEENFERKRLTVSVVDLERDGSPDLLTGDERGEITVYNDYLETINNPLPGESVLFQNELSNTSQNLFGRQFFLSSAEVFGASNAGIAVGTRSGGVQILKTSSNGGNTDPETFTINVYPNPVDDGRLVIESNEQTILTIYNRVGQPVQSNISVQKDNSVIIDTSTLPSGLYIIKGTSMVGETSRSFVVF